MSLPAPNTAPLRTLSVKEFTHAYGISRSKVYELLKSGALTAVKAGRRTLIRLSDAEAWLNALPEA